MFFSDRLTIARRGGLDAFLCSCATNDPVVAQGPRMTDAEIADFFRNANAAALTWGNHRPVMSWVAGVDHLDEGRLPSRDGGSEYRTFTGVDRCDPCSSLGVHDHEPANYAVGGVALARAPAEDQGSPDDPATGRLCPDPLIAALVRTDPSEPRRLT